MVVEEIKRKRHGCLTFWLWFTFVCVAAAGTTTRRLRDEYHKPEWYVAAWAVCAALQLVSTIALLRWKRWGFYGSLASEVILACCQVGAGYDLESLTISFVMDAILPFLLLIGKPTAWSQLE